MCRYVSYFVAVVLLLTLEALFLTDLFASAEHQDAIVNLEKQLAKKPDDPDLLYALGVIYADLGQADDEEAIDQAIALFKRVYEKEPAHLPAKAFYGCALVIKSRYANIFSKLGYIRKGLRILDETLAENPNQVEVRLIRGVNADNCPPFLKRQKVADEDFAWILENFEEATQGYKDDFIKTVYFYMGCHALKKNDPSALEHFAKAKGILSRTIIDKRLDLKLAEAQKRFAPSPSNQ